MLKDDGGWRSKESCPEAMPGCFHEMRKLKEKLEKHDGKQFGPAKYMERR